MKSKNNTAVTQAVQDNVVTTTGGGLQKLRRRFSAGEAPTESISCRVSTNLCLRIGVMAAARNTARGTLIEDILSFVIDNKEILAKFEEHSKPLIKVS